MANDATEKRSARTGVVLFAIVGLLIAWDLVTDYGQGVNRLHLAVEIVTLLTAAVGTAFLWRRYIALREETQVLGRDLQAAQAEGQRWREESRELLDGLGSAIETQFDRWRLSPAEAEIGMLLLKGLSHKEIAQVRDTSEKTVRQQARSVYFKAGLAGRSELSAFFLEDLLLPVRSRK